MTMREAITDKEITALLDIPKIIREKGYHSIKPIEKNGFVKFNVEAEATSDGTEKFVIFSRASVDDPMDFSVGLRVTFQDGSYMVLMGPHEVQRGTWRPYKPYRK